MSVNPLQSSPVFSGSSQKQEDPFIQRARDILVKNGFHSHHFDLEKQYLNGAFHLVLIGDFHEDDRPKFRQALRELATQNIPVHAPTLATGERVYVGRQND